MRTTLHDIGRFDARLGFLYVDRAAIKRSKNAIAIHDAEGTVEVPLASLSSLMLSPGCSITHAAVRDLADYNCLLLWVGELGVRFYACGMGGARHSRNLLRQARLALDERTRLQVVVRMYTHRFEEEVDDGLTLQQLRGKEGIRVRQAYREAADRHGVPWQGRRYDRTGWDRSDPVNQALSAANSCLYGLVHAAILSGGYSPAIGFIHTGKQRSLVYDLADLYKAELTIPLAFEMAAEAKRADPDGFGKVEALSVRAEARRRFHRAKLVKRILPDLRHVLSVEADEERTYEADPAKPADLWEPDGFGAETPIREILAQLPLSGAAKGSTSKDQAKREREGGAA